MNYSEEYLKVAKQENNEILHSLMALNAQDTVNVIVSEHVPDYLRAKQVEQVTNHHINFLARIKNDDLESRQATRDQAFLLTGVEGGAAKADKVVADYESEISSGKEFEKTRKKILRQYHSNVIFAAEQSGYPKAAEFYESVMQTSPSRSTLASLYRKQDEQDSISQIEDFELSPVEKIDRSQEVTIGLARRFLVVGSQATKKVVSVVTGSFRMHPELQHAGQQQADLARATASMDIAKSLR